VHVRAILGNIGVIVLPDQLAVSKAHEAFNADGTMSNAKQQAAVAALGASVADILARLNGQALLPAHEERRHDLSRLG
jgi:hypothetical protein